MRKVGLYDLANHPTTFDIATWCVIAKTHGVNHVQFVYDGKIQTVKYPETIAWRRFANILIPVTHLARMTYSMGPTDDEGSKYPFTTGYTIETYKRFGRLDKLKSVLPAPAGPYTTITLRESFRNKYRNSNVPAWMKFRKYLESRGKRVIMLPECEDDPIDVLQRMALYTGAEMNLGTSSGPMALCMLSDAPYIVNNICPTDTFDATYDMEKLLRSTGYWQVQLPFANAKQLIGWEPDTYENIVREYESLMDERVAA